MLCTRLCHDLTGPIGAVNNGAEFLSEEGFNLQNQAVELITTSAFSAVARLMFYRLAYGRVKDHGEASLAESQRIAADFFSDGKTVLDWPDQYTDASGVSLSMRMMRLLYNFLMIATGSLLKGGKVSVKIEQLPDHSKCIEVRASGDAMKWEKETEVVLSKPIHVSEVTPKNVQLYLTQQLAEELQATIYIEFTEHELCIRAIQKMTIDA